LAFVVASLAVGGRVSLLAMRTRQLPEMSVSFLMLDSPWFASIPDIVSALLGFVVAGSLSLACFPRKVRNAAAEAPEEAAS